MDLEHLKIFISVVENGGFSQAARALYISHSTTSRAVAALESELGARLLERNSRGIELTPAGRALWEAAPDLLAQVEALKGRVKALG